jgi:hypothetical protein
MLLYTFCKEFFGLMTIADCPLLGQSAKGPHFYDDSGRCPEKKHLFHHLPPLAN